MKRNPQNLNPAFFNQPLKFPLYHSCTPKMVSFAISFHISSGEVRNTSPLHPLLPDTEITAGAEAKWKAEFVFPSFQVKGRNS